MITGLTPRWPKNLSELHLSKQEARTIEVAASMLRQALPPDQSNRPAQRVWHRNKMLISVDGQQRALPRTILVSHKKAVVILNTHGGMPALAGGAEQGPIKIAWDLEEGAKYVKKTIPLSFQQSFYHWLQSSKEAKPVSMPEVGGSYMSCGKVRILEKFYPYTAEQWLCKNPKIYLQPLAKLQAALVRMHQFKYYPPTLTWEEGPGAPSYTRQEPSGAVFHGDISGRNIMVSFPAELGGQPLYKLIDFGTSARFDLLAWSPGYGSPETMRQHLHLGTLSTTEFNLRYGQRRDTWAFGLLIGSLLRGGFHRDYPGAAIPKFDFITRRIHRDKQRINDDAIADLTQHEVDSELDAITSAIRNNQGYSHEVKQALLRHWRVVRAWLRVDPEERKPVLEYHVSDS